MVAKLETKQVKQEEVAKADHQRGERNSKIAHTIHVRDGETREIDVLNAEDCFIGLVKTGNGTLIINELRISGYGGDAINIRGSNFINNKLITRDPTPTRPYETLHREGNETVEECLDRNNVTVYDPSLLSFDDNGEIGGYHCDGIAQLYAVQEDGYTLDDDGVIENIVIKNIDAELGDSQGLSCTERCEYRHFEIGTESLRIDGSYKYPLLFNSLHSSEIGNDDANIKMIRIKDVKNSGRKSYGLKIKGIEQVIGDIVNNRSVKEWCNEHGIEEQIIDAIRKNESTGKARRYGMPAILFERHVHYRALKDNGFNPAEIVLNDNSKRDIIDKHPYKARQYGSYKKQVKRYKLACTIDEASAIEACSWGTYQILGENYAYLGFEDQFEFRDAIETDEVSVFLSYLESKPELMNALRAKDFAKIKRLYQGSKIIDDNNDGEDDYTAKLVRNYTRSVQRANPRKKLIKSRTIRNTTIGGVAKAATGGAVLYGAEGLSTIMRTINEQADRIKELKGQLTATTDKVKEITNMSDEIIEKLATMEWMPYAIGAILLIMLIPHIKVFYAYLQDNGYI